MTATYVLEGILREALENREFREVFEVFAVPFADRDGVVDGDQGKNRRPHDHARDYGDNPIYSETANIMKLVRQEKMNVVFDLHCPWIYQGCNESIYFVGPELKRMEEGTLRLSGLIENDPERKVPFTAPPGTQAPTTRRGKPLRAGRGIWTSWNSPHPSRFPTPTRGSSHSPPMTGVLSDAPSLAHLSAISDKPALPSAGI